VSPLRHRFHWARRRITVPCTGMAKFALCLRNQPARPPIGSEVISEGRCKPRQCFPKVEISDRGAEPGLTPKAFGQVVRWPCLVQFGNGPLDFGQPVLQAAFAASVLQVRARRLELFGQILPQHIRRRCSTAGVASANTCRARAVLPARSGCRNNVGRRVAANAFGKHP